MSKKELASQSQGHFLFVTDNKDNSRFWFEDGLKKALDGYAQTTMVDRSELQKRVDEKESIMGVIVDSVYTDWKTYIPELKKLGLTVVVACASPTVEDARYALMNGAQDYFVQSLDTSRVRNDVLGK